MRILYKYLTTSLFPRHSEPEVKQDELVIKQTTHISISYLLSTYLSLPVFVVGWKRLSYGAGGDWESVALWEVRSPFYIIVRDRRSKILELV